MQTDIHQGQATAASGCPAEHAAISHQKTAQAPEPAAPPIERDARGVWHVRSYALAREILRGENTRQAGFRAELLEEIPSRMKLPILYLEGQEHHTQRRQTARFFTPRAVGESYRAMMESLSDQLIIWLLRHGRADLSQLSMALAVRVAGQIVGLTSSRLPGMARRLNAFFENEIERPALSPRALLNFARSQLRVLAFFWLDVKPAIAARRRQPGEDVISHLLGQGRTDAEILTECITYAAAGMATTREFICVAAWHLLEQPELRRTFLRADEATRHELLQEILRVEPVVGNLLRRATADIPVAAGKAAVTIPSGALINLHVYGLNADPAVVGAHPQAIQPGRELLAERTSPALMSFGDGHHRCPGAYVAIQESDIFLRRLLALGQLRIERMPSLGWSELVTGYELRNFVVAVA